ncbi:MAG: SDR family oxidoreductase [Gemmatimonadetes bacterium]|nr:SDR family oxidoreductase [Gemmatimonadota bacterium]MCC7133038.1 SDR family oxidoreductase [Gemmatimonadales bacterium]
MTPPVALVTGATEGIGRAVCFSLGRAGYAVAAVARTPDRVRALVVALEAAGIRAFGYPADVSDPDAVAALVSATESALGPVDVLVNNAGILIDGPVLEMSLEAWDRTFAVNVRSLFLTCRAVLPGMVARGRGDIVNIASLAGKNGVLNAAAYAASKHAVLGFSRSLMLEVRKQGVRVIAICPGSVDTPMMHGQGAFAPAFDRILQPEDVAAAVVDALSLPRRAMVSELDIRPSNP